MLKSLKKEYLESPYTDEYTLHELEEEEFQEWKKDYRGERDKKKLWDQIGFHRPIAGFWHNFMLQILIIILPTFWAGFLLSYLYPFPEMRGLKIQFTGIFILVFTIFDLGTSATISRFIADENIKNPGEMVKYVQYFIWYQAITGLLQMSVIAFWAIKVHDLYFGNRIGNYTSTQLSAKINR